MRTTLKLILPLIVSVVVVSILFAAYQVRTERRILRGDLSRRAEILAESLQENVEPQLDKPSPDKGLQRLVDRFGQREHLKGVAIYNASGVALAVTSGLASLFQLRPAAAAHAAERDAGYGEFLRVGINQPPAVLAQPDTVLFCAPYFASLSGFVARAAWRSGANMRCNADCN